MQPQTLGIFPNLNIHPVCFFMVLLPDNVTSVVTQERWGPTMSVRVHTHRNVASDVSCVEEGANVAALLQITITDYNYRLHLM
jgi:hypothetical protein